MTKRVLIALTSHDDLGGVERTGYYVPEAAHPWEIFRKAGFDVDVASVRGGEPPQDGYDPADPAQVAFVASPSSATPPAWPTWTPPATTPCSTPAATAPCGTSRTTPT
ncbi:hypothetical protein ACFQ0B_73255 [Nonomuraea thailandensis]